MDFVKKLKEINELSKNLKVQKKLILQHSKLKIKIQSLTNKLESIEKNLNLNI